VHKYYIVTEDLIEAAEEAIKIGSFEFINDNSAIVHTELTLEELQEYLKKLEPKIPY